MANLHLVTGYAGYEHIKATDQAAFNAALIGTGQFVLEKGGIFEAQVHTNNLVRVLDGELMMQGRFIRLDPGTYVDLEIENGEQGKLRNDIIVARYTKDIGTGVEECNLVVIKGESVASNPADPAHEEGDITNGVGTVHDFPLWRLPIDGINVGEPESLFGKPFMDSMHTLHSIREDVDAQLEEQKVYFAEQETKYEAAFEEQNERFQKAVDAFGGYTKDEVLTDETKVKYGKDSTAVPDDVFSVLYEDAFPKIGDIKVSARTDLGEKWLLCNGEQIDHKVYLGLKNFLNKSSKKTYHATTNTTTKDFSVSDMYEHNGTYIACGSYYSSWYYPIIWITNNPSGEWEEVVCSSGFTPDAIRYYNDTWVCVGTYYSSNYAKLGIMYSTAEYPNKSSNWTNKMLSNNNSVGRDIGYHDGLWVAVCDNSGASGSSRYIHYASNLTDTWSTNSSVDAAMCINYYDDMWVIGGSDGKPCVWTSTNPSGGTWTKKVLYNDSGTVYRIEQINGKYIAVGGTSSDSGKPFILVADSILGEWTLVYQGAEGGRYYDRIVYGDGEYALHGYSNKALVTKDLTVAPESLRAAAGVAEYDGGWLTCSGAKATYGSTTYTRAAFYVDAYYLPTIDSDASYAYIKAKE